MKYGTFSATQKETLSKLSRQNIGEHVSFGEEHGMTIHIETPPNNGVFIWSIADGQHAITITSTHNDDARESLFNDVVYLGPVDSYLCQGSEGIGWIRVPMAVPIDQASKLSQGRMSLEEIREARELANRIVAQHATPAANPAP